MRARNQGNRDKRGIVSQPKSNMVQYQIVCANQQPFRQPATHAHIVTIGTSSADDHDKYWTLEQVLQAMANDDTFYTVSSSTGEMAQVERFFCTQCSKYFIRSGTNAVTDNHLDKLPVCRT